VSPDDTLAKLEVSEAEALASLGAQCKGNPQDALAWECLGIVQLRSDKSALADDSFDKAIALTPKPSRSLMLNRAIATLSQKATAFGFAKRLSSWIKASNVPADDELLNIYGSLLDVAVSAGAGKNKAFAELVTLYEFKNAELESTRNARGQRMQRRWGTLWISDYEFRSRREEFDSATRKYRQEAQSFSDAQKELARAKAEASKQRRQSALRGKFNTGAHWADQAAKRAADWATSAKREMAEARQRVKYPIWPTTYPPITPVVADESDTGNSLTQQIDVEPEPRADVPQRDDLTMVREETADAEAPVAPPRSEPTGTWHINKGDVFAEVVKKLGLPNSRREKDPLHYTCIWQKEEKVEASIFDFEGEASALQKKITIEFENDQVLSIQQSLQ